MEKVCWAYKLISLYITYRLEITLVIKLKFNFSGLPKTKCKFWFHTNAINAKLRDPHCPGGHSSSSFLMR